MAKKTEDKTDVKNKTQIKTPKINVDMNALKDKAVQAGGAISDKATQAGGLIGEKAGAVIKEGKEAAIAKVSEIDAGAIKSSVIHKKDQIQEGAIEVKEKVINVIDANGNGEIDIEDIIIVGLRTPGVRVNRDAFLRTEFKKHYPTEVIDVIVDHNPAYANIPTDTIDKLADEVIKYERNFVSGISAALGVPGGAAMAATIPADIMQYYAYMLRAAQKLMYLYGFPEIEIKEGEQVFDSEIINTLIVCLGTMYGVAGANNALKAMAKALGEGVQKQLMKKALTKGTIYPIVKEVSKWFGVKMTKEVFTGFFKKAIPVAGGVIGGGITYATFKPCCVRLKNTLKDTFLSNPGHIPSQEEIEIVEGMVD